MKHFRTLLILSLFIFFAVSGCTSEDSEIYNVLAYAEDIMEEKPEEAYRILSTISISKSNKRDNSRLSLLTAMAIDKIGTDDTTFSIIQPAIDYLNHADPVQKQRTLYYQGRIYQNRHQYADAITIFTYAIDMGKIMDTLTLARSYVARAVSYCDLHMLAESTNDYIKSSLIYKHLFRGKNEAKSIAKALNCTILLEDHNNAKKLYGVCDSIISCNPETYPILSSDMLTYLINYGDSTSLSNATTKLISTSNLTEDQTLTAALAYCRMNRPQKALLLMNSLNSEHLSQPLRYWAITTLANEIEGNHTKAYLSAKRYNEIITSVNSKTLSREGIYAHQRILQTKDRKKEVEKNSMKMFVLLASLTCLLILSYLAWWCLNKKRTLILNESKKNLSLNYEKKLLLDKNDSLLDERASLLDKNMGLSQNIVKVNEKLIITENEITLKNKELNEIRTQLNTIEEIFKNTQNEDIQNILKSRMDILNELLKNLIENPSTKNSSYKDILQNIISDKEKFLYENKLLFSYYHPHVISKWEQDGLTTKEIGILCLYAIGINGKVIGAFLNTKSNYNITSEIRRKLNLGKEDGYINAYAKKLLY